jgi:hypothetical protein
LPLNDCDYADDGAHDQRALELTDDARFRELACYQALVASWNRQAFHRRRLGKAVGSVAAFLSFVLAAQSDES